MQTHQPSTFRWTFVGLVLALFLLITPAVVTAEPSVQDLVAGLDKKALHAALHESSNGKYKHGVFQGDIDALVAMHKSAPEEATRIIQLVRRQSNGTIPLNTITEHISGGVRTSTTIGSTFFTTLPNGQRSTVTSQVVVVATGVVDAGSPGESQGGSSPSKTTTGSSSLQTNAADRSLLLTLGNLAIVAAMAVIALL